MSTNLSEKIKFINRQNELLYGNQADDEREKQSEDQLVNSVEQVWADAQAQEETVESRTGDADVLTLKSASPVAVTNDDIYLEMKKLNDKVAEMMASMAKFSEEIVKINKHINATQKLLKKTKEKK